MNDGDLDFGLVNQGPIFDDPRAALTYMDEQQRVAIAELEAEALARMSAADPTEQNYFLRLDTNTVVGDEKEYVRCQRNRIPLKVIPYARAVQALKEEEASKRKAIKSKHKRKAARQARKRNR